MILPSQAELQALLDYDPLTGILTWKHRPDSVRGWNKRYAGKPAFTATNEHGYKVGAINSVNMKAHRVIFKLVYGFDPVFIDHEDHDRSNNRLTNLRDASRKQNQQNMKKTKANSSGTTGVSWNAQKNGWDAYIGVNGRKKYLGRFKTIQEAQEARSDAELLEAYHQNHGQ